MYDDAHDDDGDARQLQPPAEYIDQRIRLFERLRDEHNAFVNGAASVAVCACGVY